VAADWVLNDVLCGDLRLFGKCDRTTAGAKLCPAMGAQMNGRRAADIRSSSEGENRDGCLEKSSLRQKLRSLDLRVRAWLLVICLKKIRHPRDRKSRFLDEFFSSRGEISPSDSDELHANGRWLLQIQSGAASSANVSIKTREIYARAHALVSSTPDAQRVPRACNLPRIYFYLVSRVGDDLPWSPRNPSDVPRGSDPAPRSSSTNKLRTTATIVAGCSSRLEERAKRGIPLRDGREKGADTPRRVVEADGRRDGQGRRGREGKIHGQTETDRSHKSPRLGPI